MSGACGYQVFDWSHEVTAHSLTTSDIMFSYLTHTSSSQKVWLCQWYRGGYSQQRLPHTKRNAVRKTFGAGEDGPNMVSSCSGAGDEERERFVHILYTQHEWNKLQPVRYLGSFSVMAGNQLQNYKITLQTLFCAFLEKQSVPELNSWRIVLT